MAIAQHGPFTSPPRRLTTSFYRYASPRLQEEKMESLQTQYEYLNLLRLRHLQWMNSAVDPEVRRIHLEIAERIEEITDRYRNLLQR